MIDAWENYETFTLQPHTSERGIYEIYFGKSSPNSSSKDTQISSIPDKSICTSVLNFCFLTSFFFLVGEFLRRFRVFTNGVFDGWQQWDHMAILGGTVQICLNHVQKSEDLDMYVWSFSFFFPNYL